MALPPANPRCQSLRDEYNQPGTTDERKLEILAEMSDLACPGTPTNNSGNHYPWPPKQL